MTQLIELMDKLKDLGIVRFFSGIFTEERMAEAFQWFRSAAGGERSASATARDLLLLAVLLALITFVVDQVFYWTNPDMVTRSRRTLAAVNHGVHSLGENVRYLVGRVRGRR